ncbi:MAG: ABC transporter permease [Acidobacteria bacterium]|nr:ABC transporter permease [Acidobacteriota bacterium]MCB9377567.1 ABC transporter permease [Holophagales bacterium]
MRDRVLRVRELVRKEFLQLFRDPRMARILFVAPVLQLVLFGYAVSTEVRHARLFVVDQDGSPAARELVDAMTAGGYFDVVGRSARPADLVRALERADALAGLVIPVGYEEDLAAGRARVQLLFDGTDSNTATIAKGYAERIVGGKALALAEIEESVGVELRLRAWFNPDLDSRNYNVPAVIGAILLLICQLLTALAVVREREIGTLDQLVVSPLEPLELVLGKTIPFALLSMVDLALISAVALLWFGVPFRGNPLLLLGAAVLFIFCALGIGLLISTVSKTQQEAFLSSFLVFMPTMLLSGFMFPVTSMPPLFRWLTLANPLRHFLEIVRGVFLKGVTAADVWPQLAALALIATLLLGASVRRFARQD